MKKEPKVSVTFTGPTFQEMVKHPDYYARQLFGVRHALIEVSVMIKKGRTVREIERYVDDELAVMEVTVEPAVASTDTEAEGGKE